MQTSKEQGKATGEKNSDSVDILFEGDETEAIPEELRANEAGRILGYVRNELQISRSDLAKLSDIPPEFIQSFEEEELPINRRLWKAYVKAVVKRQDVTTAKACGLLRSLIKETLHYGYHKDNPQ
ncbi:MAG: hypothetical protein ABEK50_18645 [bacterium]